MKKVFTWLCSAVLVLSLLHLAGVTSPAVAYADEPVLPSALTLVGTNLPPIDDQGAVGCCVSEAAAYMQFTNAVSRYMHANYPDVEWDPSSGNPDNIFSPKFIYTISGDGVTYVYPALMDHGCATQSESSFYKRADGGNAYKTVYGDLVAQTLSWDNTGDVGYNALNYRLTNYERVRLSRAPYVDTQTPEVNGHVNIKFTTSEAGQALLRKIKDALVQGNVVTAGGCSNSWNYAHISGTGTYGQENEWALVSASGTESGGHEISIVGYDDDITVVYNGVTMRGAFLVANSWGVNWKNNGYVWLMYDAVNTVSEYPGLANYPSNRTWALDGFVFTYWDRDIAVFEKPDLMLKVDITAANREATYLVLTMCDKATGAVKEYVPSMFYYGIDDPEHPDFGIFHWTTDTTRWLTFSGIENGPAETKTFYLSYQPLLNMIPEGKTPGDYVFGARFAASRSGEVSYSNISLLSGNGDVLEAKTTTSTCVSTGINDTVFGRSVAFSNATKKTITVPGGDGYFLNYKSDTVDYGGTFEFTVSTALGYSSDNMVVKANGTVLQPVAGKYTINNVRENITILVLGVTKTNTDRVAVNFYADGQLYSHTESTPGTSVSLPPQPVKAGYTFVGWAADIYEQEYGQSDGSFPSVVPACSFNAYAVFEKNLPTQALTGAGYGPGMGIYEGRTVLLYEVFGDQALLSDLWNNRQKYRWTLHYTYSDAQGSHSFEQKNIAPTSEYEFSECKLFRFPICEALYPFLPVKNVVYYITLTIQTEDVIYTVTGDPGGYYITEDPIYPESNVKNATALHYFSDGNDFEYWSGKTYMTLRFSGWDSSVYDGDYLWILHVTDDLENTYTYYYYPNSFYGFSSSSGLVRFPIFEFGWVPLYGSDYSIDFEVHDGNKLLYTATLSDVSCYLRYDITWNINGESFVNTCRLGKIPTYPNALTFTTSLGVYDHITWISQPKPAMAPHTYTSLGSTVGNPKFKGAALTLQNDLKMKFVIRKEYIDEMGYDDLYAVFRMNGREVTVSDYTSYDNNHYAFSFANIAPHEMNDTITARIYGTYKGLTCVSEDLEYSVAQYCYSQLSKSTTGAALRTLLVDLLHYGAASQVYTGHNAENPADADLTAQQLSWGTSGDPELESVTNPMCWLINDPSVTWKGVSLILKDAIAMQFFLQTDSIEGITIKMEDGSGRTIGELSPQDLGLSSGYYVARFEELGAGQMSDTVYVTAYRGTKAVSHTVAYSIESYACAKQNDSNVALANLVKAMMKYGNAAYAYAHPGNTSPSLTVDDGGQSGVSFGPLE